MAKTYLNEENMRDIIWGATLMGGGGGGSISSGMMLLDSYKKDHPDETLSVEMIDAGDMPKGTYAAATAGMGAPAAIAGVDFSAWAANAFAVLRDLAARDGKKLGYNYPVELGGFSTFFPLLLSLKTGLPTVDCDGAGRAVPALETLLLNVNDCPTSPLEEHAKHPHSPHLFVSPKTGTMFDPDSFRHTHEKILKAIGAEHIRFHDLRHTFATLSLKYGVDVKTLSGALGHYDAGFTLSTYTHATEGMKRDAADTIGSVISQTM